MMDNVMIVGLTLTLTFSLGFLYIYSHNNNVLAWSSAPSINNTVINPNSSYEGGQSDMVAVESLSFFQSIMSWSGSVVDNPSIAFIPTIKVLSLLTLIKCGISYFAFIASTNTTPLEYFFMNAEFVNSISCFIETMRQLFPLVTNIPDAQLEPNGAVDLEDPPPDLVEPSSAIRDVEFHMMGTRVVGYDNGD